MAERDQGEIPAHPWTYTDKCHMCGGVKGFIDWLESTEKVEEVRDAN
jgi:hypothetical protein